MEIHEALNFRDLYRFADLREAAIRIEKIKEEKAATKQGGRETGSTKASSKRKGNFPQSFGGSRGKTFTPREGSSGRRPQCQHCGKRHEGQCWLLTKEYTVNQRPTCAQCGKRHEGECRLGTAGCFTCGEVGHQARQCPQRQQERGEAPEATVQGPRASERGGHSFTYAQRRGRGENMGTRGEASQAASNAHRPTAQTRVYAITRQDAVTAPQVITGQVMIFGLEVCALIDPGSTHSYIASELVDRLKMKYEDMHANLCVRTPFGDSMLAHRICKDCFIEIGGAKLRTDLVVIPLQDFNVILGMDWLGEHHVIMNCFTREVRIYSPGQPEVLFHRDEQGLACCII